jgi:hypothetical protein
LDTGLGLWCLPVGDSLDDLIAFEEFFCTASFRITEAFLKHLHPSQCGGAECVVYVYGEFHIVV